MVEQRLTRIGQFFLLASIFAAAACAIVYELLIGSTSSYFLGDSVEQYSLTIGFFLFAMGIGSWLSRWVRHRLLGRFIALEIWLGLVGGLAVAVLYGVYASTGHYRYWMLVLIMAIGTLIGLEIPLLTRILRSFGPLRATLANVLSMDYLGSLIAALLFPYLLLPELGSLRTGLCAGLLNTLVGVAVLGCFWHQLEPGQRRTLAIQGGGVVAILGGLLVFSGPLVERWESSLFVDQIVHSQQSPYQRIVLTQWGNDTRLYLDGHLQFASVDEYRYHEALVHPAMAMAASRQRVLIIGGGDGLSAREVLKYPEVETVHLVDLDPAVTDLARRHIRLTALNNNALSQTRVKVFNEDGFIFLQRQHQPYGVIILDLPDPREEALTKLYSVEGYQLCRRHLGPGGTLVTQATSPYYARQTYWGIGATLEAAGFNLYSYHTLVPSFGQWGFHLAAPSALNLSTVDFTVPCNFLSRPLFDTMLVFPADMSRIAAEVNHLDRPLLARSYRREWGQW